MDQQKLRTLVFEKTGVRIDVDDPIFALVALNEAVLAEAVERHVALLDDATATLAGALERGGIVAPAALPPATEASASGAAAGWSPRDQRMALIAGAAALLCAIVVLTGQAMFFKQPPQVPVIMAKELTGEQALALKHAEKLSKIVAKLDQKTRNTIQAEMQRP